MNDYMRAFIDGTPGDSGPLRFIAGTEGLKMDGRDYRMSGMDLDRYRSNPVVMWNHDLGAPPIGRGVPSVVGDKLMLEVEFDMADPFAAEIDGKYRRGFLKAVSMTALPTDGRGGPGPRRGVVEHSELVEVSSVPVPLDPDALQVAGARSLRQLTREVIDLGSLLRSMTDTEAPPAQIDAVAPATAEQPPSQGAAPSDVAEALAALTARLDALEGSQQVTPPEEANDLEALSAIAAALPMPEEG